MDFHFHFLLISFLLLPSRSHQQQQSDDVRSLLEFKKGIQVDPSGKVSGTWKPPGPSEPPCPASWYGVSCDGGGGGGSVVAVALDGLALSGDVKFSTLVGMKSLQTLSLAGNNLTGRLVPALGLIVSLQKLDLSANQFYGPIPPRITELSALRYLNLSFNGFIGSFPDGIQNLQQLKVLDVRSNSGLWGDVTVLLSELRNAEHVDLSGNGFYGGLWMSEGNLSSLANTVQYMNFSHNKLKGGFFSSDSLRMFRNLATLDVGHNELTGELPKFGSLSNLKIFRAANNQLSGSLPAELFGSSMSMTDIDLSGNEFTGSISNVNSKSLKILNLSSNALSGSLPHIESCITLDLSRNQISGDLSAVQNWGDMLEVIDLSSNRLSRNFTDVTSQFPALVSVRMSNNSLEGALLLRDHQALSTFDLSLNKLSGQIPSTLFTSLSLIYLNLSGNSFAGAIPFQNPHSTMSLAISTYPHLEYLDLSYNALSSSLPPDIASMDKLKLLDLQKNDLSGRIPHEIGKLGNLEYLDLSSNIFTGEVPDMTQASLKVFNISNNDLSGVVPRSLTRFSDASFHPGNDLLMFPGGLPGENNSPGVIDSSGQQHDKPRIRLAVIVGCIGSVVLVFFIFMAVYRMRSQEFCGKDHFRGQTTGKDLIIGGLAPNIFRSHKNGKAPTSMSFSNDHLLTSASQPMFVQKELATETVERGFSDSNIDVPRSESQRLGMPDTYPQSSGFKSSPGSPFTSSPRFVDSIITEQPVPLNVYSPDRLVGELYFVDSSLMFTAEDLSRAPAEVLGRSSHGTSYKATLDSGHMLTVKWLRVGLVKHKKEFPKEVKRIGSIRHPNIIPLRCYYWGPREQERLIISDYVIGDSLALHLYESTPRRYSRLTFIQRLKITIDVASCLCFLHFDKCLPHGNLKPTNILLSGPDLTAQLTDYGLHRLMTLSGTSEQMLNLGALGYRAPEVATAAKPLPTFKADVYAFGVIMMELLTKRSAGDIISGQSGAVDLTDWVRLCAREGRGTECFDRDIAGLDDAPKAMDELLAISLRCILPVNERPNIKTVYEDLCSIRV